MQGPCDLWIIGSPPSDATQRLTLDAATLTPDATTHPASVHLGLIDGDTKVTMAAKKEDIRADQFAGVLDQFVTEEEMMVEADLKQLEATKIQQILAGLSVYSTAAGYKQNTFGGLNLPAKVAFAVIAPKRNDATKAHVCVLYSAIFEASVAFPLGRKSPSKYQLKVKGLADPTRTAGRNIGILYETT
jgi:hypothetical protein